MRFPAAIVRLGLLKACGCALLLAGVALAGAMVLLPLPEAIDHPTPATLTLLDVRGREIVELPSATARAQQPVALTAMGRWLPQVAVALEDHRFYQHHGIDWRATLASARRDLAARRIVTGGSTITQQLIKLATGRRERTWSAKAYEMLAAWKLECRWDKQRILAEYLNRCNYGNRLVGPQAAARWYFGKNPADLTLAEACFLAGLPQAPTRFDPWRHPEKAAARYQRSLSVLVICRVISSDQAARLAGEAPTAGRFLPRHEAPHFVQALRLENPQLSGTVRTTLDLDLQHTAEEFSRAHLRTLNRNDITGAAIVILDNASGAVRALVGSPNFSVSEVNAALTAHSCGSTLKPFVYLRAIDRRILTAASILPDAPDAIRDTYADYDPQDYNRHYLGPVRVREALACSLNVPAVVTLGKVGARSTFFDLQRWGFRLPRGLDEYGAGFILGNAEVRLLDLAAAYAGLARGGLAVHPLFLPGPARIGDRLAASESTAIITDILCDNEARARTFGVRSPLALGARVAAKTGTSSGFRDAWTVGFTRDHTVAVWVGNTNGRPMREALSIRAAAPLWAGIMSRLLEKDSPVAPILSSNKLASLQVCRLTGLRPAPASPGVITEWFLPGTEPSQDASHSFATGADSQPHLVLPAEYAAWCCSPFNMLGAIQAPNLHLAITQPTDHSTFEIEPTLLRSQQMLELACSGNTGRDVHWFVNDQEIPRGSNGRVFWPLQPGAWQISARAGGEMAAVSIRVE